MTTNPEATNPEAPLSLEGLQQIMEQSFSSVKMVIEDAIRQILGQTSFTSEEIRKLTDKELDTIGSILKLWSKSQTTHIIDLRWKRSQVKSEQLARAQKDHADLLGLLSMFSGEETKEQWLASKPQEPEDNIILEADRDEFYHTEDKKPEDTEPCE